MAGVNVIPTLLIKETLLTLLLICVCFCDLVTCSVINEVFVLPPKGIRAKRAHMGNATSMVKESSEESPIIPVFNSIQQFHTLVVPSRQPATIPIETTTFSPTTSMPPTTPQTVMTTSAPFPSFHSSSVQNHLTSISTTRRTYVQTNNITTHPITTSGLTTTTRRRKQKSLTFPKELPALEKKIVPSPSDSMWAPHPVTIYSPPPSPSIPYIHSDDHFSPRSPPLPQTEFSLYDHSSPRPSNPPPDLSFTGAHFHSNLTSFSSPPTFPVNRGLLNNALVNQFVNTVPLDYENGHIFSDYEMLKKRELPRRRPRPRPHRRRQAITRRSGSHPPRPPPQRRNSTFKNIISTFHNRVSRILMGPGKRRSPPGRPPPVSRFDDYSHEEQSRHLGTLPESIPMDRTFSSALNTVAKFLLTKQSHQPLPIGEGENHEFDDFNRRHQRYKPGYRRRPFHSSRRRHPRRRRPRHRRPHHHYDHNDHYDTHEYKDLIIKDHHHHDQDNHHHTRDHDNHHNDYQDHSDHNHDHDHEELSRPPTKSSHRDRPPKWGRFKQDFFNNQPENDDFHGPHKDYGPPYKSFRAFKPWLPFYSKSKPHKHFEEHPHHDEIDNEEQFSKGRGHYRKPPWHLDESAERGRNHRRPKEFIPTESFFDGAPTEDFFKPSKNHYYGRTKFRDWEHKKPKQFHKIMDYDNGVTADEAGPSKNLKSGVRDAAVIRENHGNNHDSIIPKIIINHHHNLPPAGFLQAGGFPATMPFGSTHSHPMQSVNYSPGEFYSGASLPGDITGAPVGHGKPQYTANSFGFHGPVNHGFMPIRQQYNGPPAQAIQPIAPSGPPIVFDHFTQNMPSHFNTPPGINQGPIQMNHNPAFGPLPVGPPPGVGHLHNRPGNPDQFHNAFQAPFPGLRGETEGIGHTSHFPGASNGHGGPPPPNHNFIESGPPHFHSMESGPPGIYSHSFKAGHLDGPPKDDGPLSESSNKDFHNDSPSGFNHPFPTTKDPHQDHHDHHPPGFIPPFTPVPTPKSEESHAPISHEDFFKFNRSPKPKFGFDMAKPISQEEEFPPAKLNGNAIPPNPLSPQTQNNGPPPGPPGPLSDFGIPDRELFKLKKEQRNKKLHHRSREDHPGDKLASSPPPMVNKVESNEFNYSTLPENWKGFKPDPAHKKLPKLTYDSLETGSRSRMYRVKSALTPKGLLKSLINRFPRARLFEKSSARKPVIGGANRGHTKFFPFDAVSRAREPEPDEEEDMGSAFNPRKRKSLKTPHSIQDIIDSDSTNKETVVEPSGSVNRMGTAAAAEPKDEHSEPKKALKEADESHKSNKSKMQKELPFFSGEIFDGVEDYNDILVATLSHNNDKVQSVGIPVKAHIRMGDVLDINANKKK